MTISELIEGLYKLLLKHGDVEVYTETGCGCCMGSREPFPRFTEEDIYCGYNYADAVAL